MKVIGIDVNSKEVALSAMDNYKLEFFSTIKIETLGLLVEDLKGVFDLYKPDKINIEDSIYIQNYKTSKMIAEVVSACKIASEQAGIEWVIAPNKSWKKQVIGNGNATKEQIRKVIVEKYLQLQKSSQDIIDATAIAMWRK